MSDREVEVITDPAMVAVDEEPVAVAATEVPPAVDSGIGIEEVDIDEAPVNSAATEAAPVSGDVNGPDSVDISIDIVDMTYPDIVHQTAEQTVQPKSGVLDPDNSILVFPGDNSSDTIETISAAPNMILDTPWQKAFKESRGVAVPPGYYTNTIKRKDAVFAQTIASERGPLTVAEPRFKDNVGVPATGEHALRRVRSLLGRGTSLQIPCWHSGFWLTLRNPTESELLELHRKIGEEKINLGRQTWGMALSSVNATFNNIMMEFVIDHVYDTSVKDLDNSDLAEYLSVLDWPVVIWGVALTVYRNGFQYSRPCVNNPAQCQHVFTGIINLAKMLWVDEKRFSERQIAHMTNRGGSTMTKDSLKIYSDEFVLNHGRDVDLGNGIKAALKIPKMNEGLFLGQRWINNIVTRVMNLTSVELSENELNRHISDMSKASYLRQFEHWIESVDADGILVKKQRLEDDVLTKLLEELSSDDEVRTKLEAEISEFMADSTSAIVALTNMECPKCGHREKDALKQFKYLVPIEPLMVFFILLAQKVSGVANRV